MCCSSFFCWKGRQDVASILSATLSPSVPLDILVNNRDTPLSRLHSRVSSCYPGCVCCYHFDQRSRSHPVQRREDCRRLTLHSRCHHSCAWCVASASRHPLRLSASVSASAYERQIFNQSDHSRQTRDCMSHSATMTCFRDEKRGQRPKALLNLHDFVP